ncbi:hypothetical protein HW555_013668 [Spodoptera exigua]|uniref:Uncharacterized protein n=1 Tax=Spodoptera exigua TaxID=7107 RepID=A0A835G4M5_SPOEX|nr:hypothetical protein HW555_013668 [Spodoptera exigua]
MAGKTVSFCTHYNFYDTNLEVVAKWLSCNGEIWGVGPTAVFASAAALFLYNEAGGYCVHYWRPSTYIHAREDLDFHDGSRYASPDDTLMGLFHALLPSPSMLLEMTTASLLGGQTEIMPLGPLTRFLRQQQPQIHMTACWFLSLCYADYVRKNYCQRFNMPYLEQWQTELHNRAVQGLHNTVEKVNSFVGSVHQRLRGFTPPRQIDPNPIPDCTHTVGARLVRDLQATLAARVAGSLAVMGNRASLPQRIQSRRRISMYGWSPSRVRPLLMLSRNSETTSHRRGARAVHRTPASLVLSPTKKPSLDHCPWRSIDKIPIDSLVT